jgi:UDP-N-acetylglucosamine 2-epimerase (non-hydrolysing)/GDP/UDP-N,N'-diacetylbacillosamine 2-epimerase (hydrolysing)
MQLGEEPWRVAVSGSPALDTIRSVELLPRQKLEEWIGLPLERAPLLVTYHPVTLEYEQAERQISELLKALCAFALPVVFTLPNADTNGRLIIHRIEEFVRETPSARVVPNLGTQGYLSLMAYAGAMVGNSSSGIIEAPCFGLPVVNVGTRQRGRVRAKNVLDVGYSHEEIIAGIKKALAPEFRVALRGLVNPYGNKSASEVIVKHLTRVELNDRLLIKRFSDVPVSVPGEVRASK